MKLVQFGHRRLTSSYLSRDKAMTSTSFAIAWGLWAEWSQWLTMRGEKIWPKTVSENRYCSSLNLLFRCTVQTVLLAFQMRVFHLFSTRGCPVQSQVNSMSAKEVSSSLLVYKGIWKWRISEVLFFLLYLQKNQYSCERARFPLLQFKCQSGHTKNYFS